MTSNTINYQAAPDQLPNVAGERRSKEALGPEFKFEFKSRSFNEIVEASRLAARINAANVSEAEQDSLLKERASLLQKKLTSDLTRSEANRLQYVRWSLDRIDDSKHGSQLDALEDAIARYRSVLSDVNSLQIHLTQHAQSRRR